MAHFHLAQTTEPIAKFSRFYISTCVDLFAFANLITLYDTRCNFRDYLIPTIRAYQFDKLSTNNSIDKILATIKSYFFLIAYIFNARHNNFAEKEK